MFSCAGQKQLYKIDYSKTLKLYFHETINNKEDKKFLFNLKLIYATLLNEGGIIIDAYASEKRILDHREYIEKTISRGGRLVYNSEYEIFINGQILDDDIIALEIDDDLNITNIYKKSKQLPKLIYIDKNDKHWQEDTYGNVRIVKLINEETSNKIL